MGEVYVVLKVMPKSPEVFEEMKKSLQTLEPDKMDEEPIAFGLKAIKFFKSVPEEPGADEELENKINSLENVESVEVLQVTRGL